MNFCPPFGLFTSRLASFNALFAGVLSGSLSKCPYHLSLRSFTVLLHSFTPHFSYRSSCLILSCHLMCMIFLKVFLCKRKTSTVFSRLFVKVHSSMLYRNEYALLKSLIFTASVALLFSNICFRLLKARVVLLWMSFSVSTKIPRYLHSIHFFYLHLSLLHGLLFCVIY